jgi:hypothetical protein
MSANAPFMTARLWMVVALVMGATLASEAQTVGTFRWQLRPFCNVVTVAITQNGAVYRLEGTDDQCGGGADAASVTGTAFPNADGTIGFGLNIVTAPGGRPVHVDADISLGTFSGSWRDSAGQAGTFALTPGAASGGSPRPLPSAASSTNALRPDGGFVTTGVLGQGQVPVSGSGARMMWHPGKAAFRAGEVVDAQWDDANVGVRSTAFGQSTTASGQVGTAMGFFTTASGGISTAIGSGTTASGDFSTAMGQGTTASGPSSTAAGISTRASGQASTAMGDRTTASGRASTAIGELTTASGVRSTAMGSSTIASGTNALAGGSAAQAGGATALAFGDNVRADGTGSVALGSFAAAIANGSFVFSDRSQPGVLHGAVNANEFTVRATGGVTFQTGLAANVGVRLASNGTQWLSLSDARTKHQFRELDTDDVLARIAAMPVTEWSYDAQGAGIRHIGPTAQDFHAAFGLGEDPLRIGTLDADGVALAGVRALEARSRDMRSQHDALLARVAKLERALADALETVRALKGGR